VSPREGARGGRGFASLAVPNYRRWFIGGLTSNVGTWMMRIAQSWLVLVELTDDDMAALGLLTGLQFLPVLLLSAWAGTLADRFPKRRLMQLTQSMMLVDTVVLGILVVTGTIELWHVYLIALVDGCATAVDAPARQSFVSEVVGPGLLPNAISLNSTSFNTARLIGPGIAGVLIAAAGSTGPVFLVNGATFVVLLVMLARIDEAGLQPAPPIPRRRGNLREGLRYVAGRPDLKLLMAIGFVMGNFGFNFAITNPIMANNVFGRGAGEFGALGSLMGVGALAAALTAAARRRPRLRYVLAAQAGFAVFSLASAFAPTFEVFAALMVGIGFCAVTTMVSANALVQVSLEPGVRGRVMSLWMLGIMGLTPLVGPLVGWVGTAFGPRMTVMVGVAATGAMAIGSLAGVLRSERIRVGLDWAGRTPHWVVTRGVTEDVDLPRAR